MIILKKNISSLKSICQKAVTCCVEGSLGILDSKLLQSWSPGVWWENQIMVTKAYVGKNIKYSLIKSNVIKYIISYMQTVWHIVDFQLLRQLPLDNIWAQSGAQCLIKYIGV